MTGDVPALGTVAEVVASVLDAHSWDNCCGSACSCGFPESGNEAHVAHVAAEVAKALGATACPDPLVHPGGWRIEVPSTEGDA